jgi:hypothetical protein
MLNLFFSRSRAHSTSFLTDACFIEKNQYFSCLRIDALLSTLYIFHEHQSGGIYIIGNIVSHMVLTSINSEVHFRSASSYDINKQWRLIEQIDIVVGIDDSKKYAKSNSHEKQQLSG